MTATVERWYPQVRKWGFAPSHCLAVSFGMAALAGVLCALGVSDGWPTSMASRLALAHIGLLRETAAYHPIWGWCVRLFGLHAEWLSVLSAGMAAGLLVFCVSRAKNIVTGIVAGVVLTLSPWFLASGANVSFAAFDLALALLVVALVPLIGEPGGWWRGPLVLAAFCLFVLDMLRATIAHPAELLLEGLVVTVAVAVVLGWMTSLALETSVRGLAYALYGTVAVALLLMPTMTALSDASGGGRLAHHIAGLVLERGGSTAKWIVTDGPLEGAFAYRLARTEGGPHLVSLARDGDATYMTNLVRTVERDYPKCASLRLAAKLGVLPFLEELPFVETNEAALVSVWGSRVWDARTIARLKDLIASSGGARRDPLRAYVEMRLAGVTNGRAENRRGAALRVLGLHLGDVSRLAKGDTNHIARINEAVDRIAVDARCGDVTKLEADARQLVRNDRMNPLGNALLGSFAAAEGDDEMAVLCFRRAVGRGAVPVLIWNDYAESLRRVGRYGEAEKAIRMAIAREPNEWHLYETLADILLSSEAAIGEVEAQVAKAEALSEKMPAERKPTLAFLRGVVLWRKGNRNVARVLFRRLAALPLSPALRMRVGRFR